MFLCSHHSNVLLPYNEPAPLPPKSGVGLLAGWFALVKLGQIGYNEGIGLERRRMAKKRVYVETTVISYYAARPSPILITLAKQLQTRDWWECRHRWDLFISPVVLEEIIDGDHVAAAERLAMVRELPVLPDHPKARILADILTAEVPIPDDSRADALHLALAAFHKMDYLVTWNQTHLDNPHLRGRIERIIKGQGLSPTLVLTPERLLEIDHD